MLGDDQPLEGHPRIALLMLRGIHHLTEPVTLLHMQAILMVLMALVEDLAVAEDLDGAEDLAEEDGDKPYNNTLRAVLEYLPRLLSYGLKAI